MDRADLERAVSGPLGASAMCPIAPRWTRHAALFVLAHGSARRPRALPGTPSGARPDSSNCRLQLEAGTDCRFAPAALAGRAVLQMDRAAPAYHCIPAYRRERREHAYLECSLYHVLVATIEKCLKTPHGLCASPRILSLTIFETTRTNQLVARSPTDSGAGSEPRQLGRP